MLEKKLMLATLSVAIVFGAMAASAAADPEFALHEHTKFTVSGGSTSLETAEFAVACTSVTGSGKFSSSQEGTIEITLSGCKSSGLSCTTSGLTSGSITTTELPFRVKSATEGKLALLLLPKSGHVSSFTCSFLASVVVSGSGVIGLVTAPEYGKESSTVTVKLSGEKGAQGDTSVDGEETAYSLKAAINGDAAKSASLASEIKLGFEGAVQPVPVLPLSVDIKPAGGLGTVKSTPVGIHCVVFCRSWFFDGSKVKLEVVELVSNFEEWKAKNGNSGTCKNATTPCEVTLDKNTNPAVDLEAVFK